MAIRFDDDRGLTCFKYRAGEDPVLGTDEEHLLTGSWSDRRIGRPEAAMTGLSFSRGGYSRYGLGVPRASGAYTVWRPDHWAFEETELHYGDALGLADAIVGYEVDGCELTIEDGLPVPTHADGAPASLEVLATAPARLWTQDEQPTRYGHEPGELEHVGMAVFGEGWGRSVIGSSTTTRSSAASRSPVAEPCSAPAAPTGPAASSARTRPSAGSPTTCGPSLGVTA